MLLQSRFRVGFCITLAISLNIINRHAFLLLLHLLLHLLFVVVILLVILLVIFIISKIILSDQLIPAQNTLPILPSEFLGGKLLIWASFKGLLVIRQEGDFVTGNIV